MFTATTPLRCQRNSSPLNERAALQSENSWFGLLSAFLAAVVTIVGCGGASSQPTALPGQAVSILQQPNSLAVPIGRIATFSVTASGDQPLSYQWSKDGAAISGAISASYDVSVSGLGKDGSTSLGSYTVTVTNKFGTVVSNPATLTAGPRAPAIGDLRYLQWEQVTVPGLGNYSGVATNI